MPSISIAPPVGSSTPRTMLMVVVLPAPLGPSRPTISRAPTANETPSTATVAPYCLRKPRTESTSAIGRVYANPSLGRLCNDVGVEIGPVDAGRVDGDRARTEHARALRENGRLVAT